MQLPRHCRADTAPKAPRTGGPHACGGTRRLIGRWAGSGLLAALVLVSGCATLGNLTTAADGASTTQADAVGAQRDLAAGIDLYDKGDYVAAIRTLLTSREIWQAPLPTRVTAHKYVAFSHCLSNRPRPCKQSFSDLLQLQPDFELAAAESGHPLWRDAFRQAKREVGAAGGSVAGSSAGSARQSLAQKTR